MALKNVSLIEEIDGFLKDVPRPYVLMFSGGQDSVVLAHLLLGLKIPFFIFHVNYGLRDIESELDEKFVHDFCSKYSIAYKIVHAPKDFHLDSGLQARARDLRYTAVKEYSAELQISSILTAQHANDSVETFLFHAARGTGLDGLISMQSRNGNVFRPLWSVSKDLINDFAERENVIWRDDSSNNSNKYTRNDIRNNAIPALINAVPQSLNGIRKTQKNLRELKAYIETSMRRDSDLFLNKSISIPGAKVINPSIFQNLDGAVIINYILKPYAQFNFDSILSLSKSQIGSFIELNGWQLWSEREGLILLSPAMVKSHLIEQKKVDLNPDVICLTGNLWNGHTWNHSKKWEIKYFEVIKVNYFGDLINPIMRIPKIGQYLVWRPWKNGDYIYPLGMKGKKKVSDLLSDSKIPSSIKHKQVLLSSSNEAGEVYWIPGLKISRTIQIEDQKKYIQFNGQ